MNNLTQELSARFPPEVEQRLHQAGWYFGREVEEEVMQKWYALKWNGVPGYCRIFPAAYRFLREFGGLKLGHKLAGEFLIDPSEALVLGQEDLSFYAEWQMETRLYPLGEDGAGSILQIDIQGRFWILPPGQTLLGYNTTEALTNLLIPGHFTQHIPHPIVIPPVDWRMDDLLQNILLAEKKVARKLGD